MRSVRGAAVGLALVLAACSSAATTASGPTGAAQPSGPASAASSASSSAGPVASVTPGAATGSAKAHPSSTRPSAPAKPASVPACLTSVAVGSSVRHRSITACERGTRGGVAIVVVGVIHGDETLGLSVVSRLRRMAVPRGVDLWLVTTVNPDGLASGTRQDARHVDLNRNWPGTWAPSSPSSATYGGPSAASEPETRAFMAFLQRLRPRTVLVFHSPLDAVDFSEGADPAVTRYMAAQSGYPARTLGARPGSFTGWFNAQPWGGTAITFEFARTASSGQLDRVSRAVLALGAWRAR